MFDVRKLFPRTKKSGVYRYNEEVFTLADVDAKIILVNFLPYSRGKNKKRAPQAARTAVAA